MPYRFNSEPAVYRSQTKARLLRRVLCCMAVAWSLLGLSGRAFGDGTPYSITLTWDANTETDIAGYILRYGTAPGVYTNTIDVGNATTLIIPDLATDTTVIYFIVSAYNTAGVEGPQSFETNTNPADTAVSSIALSYGKLIPNLATGTDAYIAYVPITAGSIVVTPTAQDGAATVTVNGANAPPGSASESIAIDESTTTMITIVVTAKDGTTTRTISLNITRLTAIESWRLLYYNNPANLGPGADSAIPQPDGVTNLLKFGTKTNPTRVEEPFHTLGTVQTGNNTIIFSYRRNTAALDDGIIFTVEWSDTLEPESWSSAGVVETFVANGDTQNVTATLPSGPGHGRFVHLVITNPKP